MDALIEVIVIPVSDVDKAIQFYRDAIGFRLDVDYAPTAGFRVVQMTPPASRASIQFGIGLPDVPLGPVAGMYLVVEDVDAYRRVLSERGVETDAVRHKDVVGGWQGSFRPGLDPQRADYATFTGFRDPDGNSWTVQERGHQLAPSQQWAL
jgi:catechol 2,3-dioxygenase-like lactoylglutathione lyase family enzyme